MTTSLLVLGGSEFVGRAVVAEGLQRGWDVTTFNRGRVAPIDPSVTRIVGDRLDPATLAPLRERHWDVVVDTWRDAPRAARDSATALADHAETYVYVSSFSVYQPPLEPGFTEASATVEASPDAEEGAYGPSKRGAELAVTQAFGDRAILTRAGLLCGPHENVGLLPWWLQRVAAGGEILAPGPPELALQLIDARDLAAFVLDAAIAGRGGAFNLASRRGEVTMRTLLEACLAATAPAEAELAWVDPETVTDAGLAPFIEVPIWVPPAMAGLHGADVEKAHAAGLHCRPIAASVTDTWDWISALDGPPPSRPGVTIGYTRERERAVLDAWRVRAQ